MIFHNPRGDRQAQTTAWPTVGLTETVDCFDELLRWDANAIIFDRKNRHVALYRQTDLDL